MTCSAGCPTHSRISNERENETNGTLDLLLGKLQIGPQRIRQPVSEIHQTHQNIQIQNLLIGKVGPQGIDIRVVNVLKFARQFLRKLQGCLFVGFETAIVAVLQRLPVILGQPYSLRRSDVMLQSIMTAIDHRDANVDQFVQFAF
jgi:hypothetical protein